LYIVACLSNATVVKSANRAVSKDGLVNTPVARERNNDSTAVTLLTSGVIYAVRAESI
jgi:hypothetical protein